MKLRVTLTCLSLAVVSLAVAQLPRIILEPASGGSSQVFLTFDDALAAAQANDRLYFSGGAFTATTQVVLNGPIHFIGAGIDPDSTAITTRTTITVSDPIIMTNAASNSSFTGVVLVHDNNSTVIKYGNSDADDDPTGMVFERCNFHGHVEVTSVSFNVTSASSSSFNECVFNGHLEGSDFSSVVVTRCVFAHGNQIKSMDGGGVLVDHCVFLGNSAISNSESSTVQNTIFAITGNSALYQCTGSSVTNCLTYSADFFGNSSGTISNSFTGQSNAFVNETNADFDYTDDLHVASGSAAENGAIDGTNMGLYGSPSPAKMGFVPYNPHYVEVTIDPATDGNGDLPVHIKVQAQTH